MPLTRLAPARRRAWTYAVAAVDNRGRIAARPLLQSLDLVPGTTAAVREQSGLLVVTASLAGAARVSPEGHLHLAAPVRHRCGLVAGSRVLLVADSDSRRLVVHPPAALEAMLADCYAAVFGASVSGASVSGASISGGGAA